MYGGKWMFLQQHIISLLKFLSVSSIAYLDPGSGSFILQVLVASLVGIGFAFRKYWSKVTNLFRKESIEEEPADQDNE